MRPIKIRIVAENQEERLAVCRQCPFLKGERKCGKCGCNIYLKTKFKMCSCPDSRWGSGCAVE